MKLGVSFLSESWFSRDIPGLAARAETLRFDYLGCGEHVMFHGPVPNAFIALAAAAGATKRIRLLSSVTLLPLYPPVLAAKMVAMMDVVSGGRFDFGVGIGGEFAREFEACGVPVRQRGARTDEGLEIITRLLTEDRVSFDGRFASFTDISIEPRPARHALPPIWVAGRKEPAMRRAARFGDYWMPYMYTPDQLHRSLESVRAFAQDFGRKAGDIGAGLYLFCTVDRDGNRAKRVAAEHVGRNYNQDFSSLVDRYVVAGTPEECRRRIREYADAGASMIMLSPASADEELDSMLSAIAGEVGPEVRQGEPLG